VEQQQLWLRPQPGGFSLALSGRLVGLSSTWRHLFMRNGSKKEFENEFLA
jgi:hypothetical protein